MQESGPAHPSARAKQWISPLVAGALVFAVTGTAAADQGRWSPASNWARGDIARYAVHMVLLRGDNNPYHSRILWFQGEDTLGTRPTFEGGEWLWRPAPDTCACFAYPTPQLDSLGVDSSLFNPFCAGHAQLAGKLLVAGGDDAVVGDYGEIQDRLYAEGSGTGRGTWTPYLPNMTFRRFYPTVTALKDGRGFVTSGWNHRQHRIWGGFNPGSPPTDSTLYRFRPIPTGGFDASMVPVPDLGTGTRPTPRSGHTAIQMEYVQPFGADVYFGGQDAQAPQNDTWLLRNSNTEPRRVLRRARYVSAASSAGAVWRS